ncbi:MAG: beta-carotene hydroxylase [Sphingobacteriales bacterium SCN 48-20]|jgi:beta-carotene 3-hydroxylase|uniref:sterol desaturase family protein n=1 Tax=Terrimonas ferruginea TaxID=249 RepID=UPI00042757E2|nr:sterol desaturase family protein [Terrimonas ferruginea]MBN8783530.1 sterol desaturase family protein [Terrimonas ferruginea]ODT92593.1 MAG: beta-carotene hydroxylase [Sphingobacteriales bacterium SCN 48-20]OJW40285.1 MAG: beta-carotene hydroxylase [Sphingobacteriales bacterium 48-107]
MSILLYIGIALATFVLMEGFTWCLHRYVMHGFLWYLHKDHHQPEPGFFEKNDAFFLIFAIPSWLLIMLGVMNQAYWSIAIGAGLSLYGFAYFMVHDVIIHQRFKWFSRSNNTYIRTLRWAHKMHHKHLDKHDGESFGMLWVAKKYWEKVQADKKRKASGRGVAYPTIEKSES